MDLLSHRRQQYRNNAEPGTTSTPPGSASCGRCRCRGRYTPSRWSKRGSTSPSGPNQGTHNVVFVATEHDQLLRPTTPTPPHPTLLWQRSFLSDANKHQPRRPAGRGPRVTTVPQGDIISGKRPRSRSASPGTPVIDPNTGTIYLIAKTAGKPSAATKHYVQRLYAVNVQTGSDKTAPFPARGHGRPRPVHELRRRNHRPQPGLAIRSTLTAPVTRESRSPIRTTAAGKTGGCSFNAVRARPSGRA